MASSYLQIGEHGQIQSDAADTGSKIGAEQPAVRGLIREPPDCAETQVDGAGCQIPRLQVHAIPKDDRAAER